LREGRREGINQNIYKKTKTKTKKNIIRIKQKTKGGELRDKERG